MFYKTIRNNMKRFIESVIARVLSEAIYYRLLQSHSLIRNDIHEKQKFMILAVYILLFIFSFSNYMQAQNLKTQKRIADSLFQSERFYDAITEYKRLLFFSALDDHNYESNAKIGLCYKAGGKYSDAIKYFAIAKSNSKNIEDSVFTELQVIKINILRRTVPEALLLLNSMEGKYPNKIDSSTICYWRGWAYIMDDKWELASIEFDKINSEHPLKKLADRVELEKYSVAFAKFASFIIPGSGQFYTGNYMSGILSLGWNVLWGYLTINAFVTERAVEGILIGSLLWARFYKGNFQNAEKFAVDRNKEISNKAYEYLSKKYAGEKP